jgi:SAM-dependent methyltransferase
MTEQRPSVRGRITRALRLARALLALPELLDLRVADIRKRLDDLSEKISAVREDVKESQLAGVAQLDRTTGSRFDAIDQKLGSLGREIDQKLWSLGQKLQSLGEEIDQKSRSLGGKLKSELAAELSFGFHDQDERLGELGSRFNALDTQVFETKNFVSHVNTSTETRFNALDTRLSETKNIVTHVNTSLHSRLDTLEFERIDALYDQLRELAANQFELRAKVGSNRAEWMIHPAERYKPATPQSFQSYLSRAERDFPRIYPYWRERLDTTLAAFRETKAGNAANAADPDSRVFRSFVEMYAGGRVLDVGCGVFGRPYYLMDYPEKLISGLEPLPMIEPVDFELVRGISEYLPWPGESFSTVISATSLDHCMSLKRSLDEVVRVLRPEGRFLLWIDSVPRVPVYEPDKPDFKPADQFHLFHFDTSWFEPMLEQRFKSITQTQLRRSAFSRVIYCLVKK